MGVCENRSHDESERFQSDYKLMVDQIKLNKVHWKKFISEVAFQGVLSHLSESKINSIMKAIELNKEFSDRRSALRSFFNLLQADKKCSARDLIVIGLLMCYGNDVEKGEYLFNFLQQNGDEDTVRGMQERMTKMMVIVVRAIPDLMLKTLANPDTKFISSFAMMDEGIFAESVRRWVPEGSVKGDKVVHTRAEVTEWVRKGELDPLKAVKVALSVYNAMKDLTTIVVDDKSSNDESN
eukprot:TRINITY_DN13118_c0_g2_i2.p1 TRINITY_DN13118_c0_g2~~TRINITY_DN13118_c0_g2_i2.p1  ORF type:complete len:238 (-),score=63.02 TRINITY_DN13118_c0_g2_i2:69-782(-)